MEQQQQQIQYVFHPEHPLVFNSDDRSGRLCWGCNESVYGPSYSCRESGCYHHTHHKLCAEVPLGLHHPLHPIHPLILFSPLTWKYYGDDKQIYKCELCKEYKDVYTYRCSRCDFNLHITCASLAPTTMVEAEFHHHPLTPFWKSITFTCDICGKEDKNKDRIWTGDWRGGLINGNGMAFAFPKHIMDVLVASLKQEVYSDFRGLKLFFTKAWAMLHLNIYLMQH
nr:uncharacterized protein LOC112006925 [Quercus suber]